MSHSSAVREHAKSQVRQSAIDMTTLSSLLPRMALLQVLEITGVVTFFLFVPVLTHGFGAEAVGIYAVVRRAMGFGIPIATIGLNESLPYSVAVARDLPTLGGALLGCLLAALAVGCAVLGVSTLFDGAGARLLFGSADLRAFVVPTALVLVSTGIAATFSSLARGLDDFGTFAWVVLGIAASPFIGLIASGGSLKDTLIAMAVVSVVLSVLAAARLFPRIHGVRLRNAFADARGILRTSIARLPGVLLMATLPLVIVLLAKETVGLARTGQFAVVLSMMVAVGGVASAFGVAALPGLAASWRSGRRDEILEVVVDALSATLALMLLGAGVIFAAAGHLGAYLFGAGANVKTLIEFSVVLVPLLGVNAVLRYVVDAISERAINTRVFGITTAITLAVCVAGVMFDPDRMTETAYVIAYFGCHVLVLLLSLRYARVAGLNVLAGAGELAKSAVAGFVAAACAAYLSRWFESVAGFAIVASASGVLLIVLLFLFRSHWLRRLLGGIRGALGRR
ncbi:MAG: hypothetical protein SGJ19_16250 [Planctomycetia bacterium]|nr:hypothetical protein [Planctomycetia bacterium]